MPGVGKNLQDHVAALVVYGRNGGGPVQKNLRLDRIALSLAQGALFGTGFTTDLPGGLIGFVKTPRANRLPDAQLLFIAGPLGAGPYLPPFKPAFEDTFACRIVVLRPESRGTISLASADPATHPHIRQNLLATDGDWQTLKAAVSMFDEVARQPALKPFIARQIAPGAERQDRRAIRDLHPQHCRHHASSLRHLQDGTCGRRDGGGRSAIAGAREWRICG